MWTKIKRPITVLLFYLVIALFASCTTTRMTISPRAYIDAVEKISSDLAVVENGYQLTGSGSDAINELIVTGHSYSNHGGYGTRIDNDLAFYDNYTYTDSIGNTIEFQIKYKHRLDYNDKGFVYNIQVVRCNCGEGQLYSVVCDENGIVKKVMQLKPDQQSKFLDVQKTYLTIYGVTIGVTLLALLPLLLL